MDDFSKALLEAVPAYARRVLVVGTDLVAHRQLWELRNPRSVIETVCGPWSQPIAAEKAPKAEAAVVRLAGLGSDVVAAVTRIANCLAPGGTLALSGVIGVGDPFINEMTTLLQERGFTLERWCNGGVGEQIARFHFTERAWPRININGDPFIVDNRPLNKSVVRVRLEEPFEQLTSIPGVRASVGPPNELPALPDDTGAKIHIIQRKFFADPDGLVRMGSNANFVMVLELDDRHVETESVPLPLYQKNLSCFHAVQTASPVLAEEIRPFNSEVGVFPNHLARIRPLPPRTSGPTVRILFAGQNRQAGWGEIIQAYREVVSRYQERVTTVAVGDREFSQALAPLRSLSRPTLSYPDYVAELDQADIALLPLADNPFDRSKSDLKFIECAEAGAVVLASHVVYGKTVAPGKTGFVYRNADEFKRHLSTLILETSTRAKMARQAHRYVTENRALANQVRERHDWYCSLVGRRDELEEARRRRVAHLG